jgi:signal transduction histidine kinase
MSLVKLVHKQLLVLSAPYVLLIVGAAILHGRVTEPTLKARLQRDVQNELTLHARHVQQTMELALGQLRRLAQQSVFRSGDTTAVIEELQRWSAQGDGLFELVYFDDLAQSAHLPDGQVVPVSGQVYYQQLLQAKDVVTDGRVSWASPKAVYSVVVPVMDDAGAVVAALGGELAATTVFPPLELDRERNDVLWYVEDAIGQKVTAATAANVGNRPPGGQVPGGRQLPNRMALPIDGDDAWVSYAVVVPRTNWRLGKSVHVRSALAPVRRFRDGFIGLAAAGLILTAAGVVWRHRTLSRRFADLIEVVQRFGASDPACRSQDQASDELGRLAEAFNHMADDVAHAQQRLKKQRAEESPLAQDRQRQIESLKSKIAELEQFSFAVAHDLKAPLVTLHGYVAGLESAAKAGDWGRFHDDVASLQSAANRLRGTIDGLLELARLDQAMLGAENVSLQRAAAEALDLLRGQIQQAQITVTIAADLPTVQGHPLRWRQVFQNLLDNAIKACQGMPSPRIDIGWERRDQEVRCFVRDSGKGLTAPEQERIFEMTQTCGGIGLMLVRRIVELYGGRTWAESAGAGKGTTIWWTVKG